MALRCRPNSNQLVSCLVLPPGSELEAVALDLRKHSSLVPDPPHFYDGHLLAFDEVVALTL